MRSAEFGYGFSTLAAGIPSILIENAKFAFGIRGALKHAWERQRTAGISAFR